jgi:uncharacterized protein YrrD
MRSNERESSDPEGTFSHSFMKNKHVETNSGESLGKIKDIVIDWDKKRVIGMELSEGFWAKLLSDGKQYLSWDAMYNWSEDTIIVPDHEKEKLKKDYNELV